MTGTKRQAEDLIPEEGPAAKRQHASASSVAATDSDISRVAVRPGDFDSLPNELLLAVAQEVANQPNRRYANLTNLRRTSKHINDLILGDDDLRESALALNRHPGVESRYVAVCHDVVGGMSVPEALRKNGPLPKADEKLRATDVDDALRGAPPEHLANLAEGFSARTGPASKEALTGVAWAACGPGPGRLRSANIHNLATLAVAFTRKNLDREDDDIARAVEAVAAEVSFRGDDLLPQANIQQIATLAGAFMRHPEDETAEIAIETLVSEVTRRGDDLLPDANIEQIATLTLAFAGHDDSEFTNFNDAMDKLASQVTARGDELLPKASAEQLATMRDMFGGSEVQLAPRGAAFNWPAEPDYPGALAKVVKEMKKRDEAERPPHDTQRRPQLDDRDRSVSVER
jgi:hypothetical protein